MRKIFLVLLLASLTVSVFSATPAKPYPDLADGDTLSATWLLGTFNVLYNWCQVASVTITTHNTATSGIHGAAAGSVVVTASETQTLTNKTLGATNHIAGEAIDSGTVADARIASTLSRDTELAAHEADNSSVHGCTAVASASALAAHEADNSSVHGCAAVASSAALTTHEADQSTHGCSEVASTSALTTHGLDQSTHGCSEVASTSALTAHSGSQAVHGCSEVASASAVSSVAGDLTNHESDQSTHGCAVVASEAAITAHSGSQSTHGCTTIASAAALAAHADATTGVHGMTAGAEPVDATGTQSLEQKTFSTGCVWNGDVIDAAYLDLGGTGAYDVAGFIPGTIPDGSANCFVFVACRVATFPAGLTDSVAQSLTAAATETVFSIWKNSSNVGTMTFATSGSTGSFTMTATQTLAVGDLWKITGPATSDDDLADIAFTFKGTY